MAATDFNERLIDIRCSNCGKKLCAARVSEGIVEIVCSKCGVKNNISATKEVKEVYKR